MHNLTKVLLLVDGADSLWYVSIDYNIIVISAMLLLMIIIVLLTISFLEINVINNGINLNNLV